MSYLNEDDKLKRLETNNKKPSYQALFGDPDPMVCECLNWAGIWTIEELQREKKHHPQCKYLETTTKNR